MPKSGWRVRATQWNTKYALRLLHPQWSRAWRRHRTAHGCEPSLAASSLLLHSVWKDWPLAELQYSTWRGMLGCLAERDPNRRAGVLLS